VNVTNAVVGEVVISIFPASNALAPTAALSVNRASTPTVVREPNSKSARTRPRLSL
jgi:hypothetical protein